MPLAVSSNMEATTKAATARPILMHKEEQIDTTKLLVTHTPNKHQPHTTSRLHNSLLTEGGRNKVAMVTETPMAKLLVRLQDMVSSTVLVYRDVD